MVVGPKLNHLRYQSSRLLQASELQLLKSQCKQERTQILTILMLSLENPLPRRVYAKWKPVNVSGN